MQAIDLANHTGCDAGVALFVAVDLALQRRPAVLALVILGDMSVQGNIKPEASLIDVLRLSMENGAHPEPSSLPRTSRTCLEVPGDVVDGVDLIFHSDSLAAALKRLGMNERALTICESPVNGLLYAVPS